MIRKRKYQFGGDPSQYADTSIFSTLADYATRQQQPEDTNYLGEAENNTNQPANSYTYEDFSDLSNRYSDLEQRLNDLQEKVGVTNYQGNDEFLGFLFDDTNNKEPIDFDSYQSKQQQVSQPVSSNGFRNFNSREEGMNALEHQLSLYQTGKTRNPVKPTSTLLEATSVYAPAADKNNPKAYANFVAKQLGVSINTPISQLNIKDWANAISKIEGNKGNNPGNLRPSKYQIGGENDFTTNPYAQSSLRGIGGFPGWEDYPLDQYRQQAPRGMGKVEYQQAMNKLKFLQNNNPNTSNVYHLDDSHYSIDNTDLNSLNQAQNGANVDDISRQGYNYDSIYRNQPSLDIHTATGEISMLKSPYTLLGKDEYGNKQIMKPGGKYKFAGKRITEKKI